MVRWLKQRWKRILAVCRIFVCACLQSYPPDRTSSTRPEAEVGAQRWSENKPCFLRLMCRLRLRCVLTPMWSLPGRELKNESHVSHGQVGLKPKKWFQLPTSPHFHQHWTGCALWQALCQGSDSPQRPPASGFCRTSRKALPGTEAGVLQNAKLEHQYNRHYKQSHQSCPAKGRQKKRASLRLVGANIVFQDHRDHREAPAVPTMKEQTEGDIFSFSNPQSLEVFFHSFAGFPSSHPLSKRLSPLWFHVFHLFWFSFHGSQKWELRVEPPILVHAHLSRGFAPLLSPYSKDEHFNFFFILSWELSFTLFENVSLFLSLFHSLPLTLSVSLSFSLIRLPSPIVLIKEWIFCFLLNPSWRQYCSEEYPLLWYILRSFMQFCFYHYLVKHRRPPHRLTCAAELHLTQRKE